MLFSFLIRPLNSYISRSLSFRVTHWEEMGVLAWNIQMGHLTVWAWANAIPVLLLWRAQEWPT